MQNVLRELITRDDVQTALPGEKDAATPRQHNVPSAPASAPKQPTRRPNDGNNSRAREWSTSSGSGNVGQVLAWGLVGIVLLLLVSALVNAILTRRRAAEPIGAKPAKRLPPTNEPDPPPPLRDYEQLASEGRYAEAVHALLLHAFVQLAKRRAKGWPAAQTGREILAAVGGFQDEDAPLRVVFHTSEAAWFGKAAVDREQYEHCLGNFQGWSA